MTPHTATEELRLILLAQAGDLAARNALVEKNMPIILRECKALSERHPRFTVNELKSDAVIGYIEGIRRFKQEKRCRLNTFALYYVTKMLGEYLRKNRSVVAVPRSCRHSRNGATVDCGRRAAEQPAQLSHDMPIADHRDALRDREREDDLDELRAAIKQLPKHLRNVVKLRMRGLSQHEVGLSLKVSRTTARAYEIEAHEILRKKLSAE